MITLSPFAFAHLVVSAFGVAWSKYDHFKLIMKFHEYFVAMAAAANTHTHTQIHWLNLICMQCSLFVLILITIYIHSVQNSSIAYNQQIIMDEMTGRNRQRFGRHHHHLCFWFYMMSRLLTIICAHRNTDALDIVAYFIKCAAFLSPWFCG